MSSAAASSNQSAHRGFLAIFGPAMVLYALVCFAAPWAIERIEATGPTRIAIAASPAIPMLAVLWAMARRIGAIDEYLRSIQARALLIGAALTLAFTTLYGFLELLAGAPDFPLFLVLPVFFGCWGLASFLPMGPRAAGA
jgi:hypothetical protein